MSDRFKIDPIRGIAAPTKDNYIKKRGRVRNKAMKNTKDRNVIDKSNELFDGTIVLEFK